jgi:rhodanese-related sulfurtransferase
MAQILLLGGDNIEKRVSTMVGRRLPVVVALAWLAAFTGAVPADSEVVSPDSIPGTTKVDAEGVLELAEKNPELVIVDARIRQDRLQGYIEGSISLPDVDTSCESLARVIPRKSTPILFYCNGPKCGRSVHSSRKALGCGYASVYWYRGGFEEWKNKNYPYLKK